MTWAHARRVLVLVSAALLCAASAVPLSRLRLDADVIHLMPREAGAVNAFQDYLEHFGSLDALYVYVEAPADGAVADYRDYVATLAGALRQRPEVTRVDAGPADPGKDWSYLLDRQLLLLDAPGFAEALHRTDPSQIGARVRATRDLLSMPSPELKALAQRDPLGWFELLRTRLQASSSLLQLDPSRTDGYVTADGRGQLLVVHPIRPPFDTTFARQLLDAVRDAEHSARAAHRMQWSEEELPEPRMDVAGGHRTAVETETLVRRESISNTVMSLVGVLTLLYLAFRSVWLVLFGALPVILATVVTLAGFHLAGVQLSAAATGASAMLFGLGDDGLVLLFVAYREQLARGLSPAAAVGRLGKVGVSVFLGAITTAATFLGLAFMSFPSVRQLGLVIGIGMLLTVLFTLTVLIAGLPGRAWATQARDLTLPGLAVWIARHRRSVLWGAALVSVPLLVGLFRLQVDPSLERLRPGGEGQRLEATITERFGLARDLYLLVDRGPSLEALLTRQEQVTDTVRGVPGLQLAGAATVLPSTRVQADRQAALRGVSGRVSTLADAVDAAAAREGFVVGTFAPFRARAATVLDPAQDLTLDGLSAHGLADLAGRFVRRDGDGFLTAAYASAASPAALDTLKAAVARQPGLVLTGLPLVNQSLAARFPRELATGLGVGSAIVVALIWLEFRAVRPTLFALLPTACGIVWGLGALGWAGVVLDLFSVFAILMFLGIGVDYGIHLIHPTISGNRASIAESLTLVGPAMLLAGATTIVGFGTLIWSDYGPLHSRGLVSVATIGASLIAALLVLPACLLGPGAKA
ncbi:MAG: MMPL family transporter [Luteitalea sp.]